MVMMAHSTRKKIYASAALIGLAAATIYYIKKLIKITFTVEMDEAIANGKYFLENSQNVLAFTAHPDDLEFLMGGTLKLLSSKGCKVTVVDVTSGEKGVNIKNLKQIREKEQQHAGRVLGINNIEFLHLEDLNLKNEEDLGLRVRNVIEKIKPDTIFAFDYMCPLKAIKHPDHITAGESVYNNALYVLGDEVDVFFYGTCFTDTVVDISKTIREKILSVRCHKSQLRFNNKLYNYGTLMYAVHNAKNTPLRYAETFRRG
jgi:LmbE family N-acetylglucosaminyl deacetylase